MDVATTNATITSTTLRPQKITTTIKPVLNAKALHDESPIEVKESISQQIEHVPCVTVELGLRTSTFNVTFGPEEFCSTGRHGFNMTYNIPLSKFMLEKRFDLTFS